MTKILEFITELFGWIQIVFFPSLIGLVVGAIVFYYMPDNVGLTIGIVIAIVGLVVGVIFATRVWKK